MSREAPRIGVEVLLLSVILAVLGAGLALIVQAHGRVAGTPTAKVPVAVLAQKVASAPPAIVVDPPAPPPLDLTPERLRPIEALIATEKARAYEQSRRAAELLEAANRALGDARQSRIEEMQVRKLAEDRESAALRAEYSRDQFSRERDVLAAKRDDARASLERQRLRSRDGVAVLPYKGPNGTWRRPIAIECSGNKATLQPGGPSFSMEDMTSSPNPRRGPLVYAVARAMARARSTRTPDGSASVPYLMFIVRPDGVRPYYAARTLLEPLGITYGYELADADWDIEFPDLDDPSEWAEVPGPKTAPTWPPPAGSPAPVVGLAAKGSGEGPGIKTAVVPDAGHARGGAASGGPGTAGIFTGLPANGVGGMGSTESYGRLSLGNPAGVHAGAEGSGVTDRPLASPGDGRGQVVPGSNASPRSGTNPGGVGSHDIADAERLGSGENGLMPVPSDGRVAWRPGQSPASRSTSFQPSPPSDSRVSPGYSSVLGAPRVPERSAVPTVGGAGVTSGSSPSAMARSGSPTVAGDVGGGGGGTGSPTPAGAQPSIVAGSNTYREAIARGHGLVAPTIPGSSGRSVQAGGQAASPGGDANSASAAGGSPGGSGGSGAAGQRGSVRDPFASQSFLIVVSCDRGGVTIHPSGEAIAFDAISRDDTILPAKLRVLVESKQHSEPEVGLRPRVNFLVKPGGEVTYLKARWQTTTATSYPTTWQLVNRGGPRLTDLEAR